MNLTLIALDRATPDFAAAFTRNAMPGAPVIVGRQRLHEPRLRALIVNNKVANVCAPDGVADAERICAAVAKALGAAPQEILPSSTGVIGWSLPVTAMLEALPGVVAALSASTSILPAAEAIMTTDLYPKVRGASVGEGGGRIVAIAKGAGMIEPHLATMLAFVLTDLAVPREILRRALATAVNRSFNCMSVDGDTSTSDTVVALSSGAVPCPDVAAFETALGNVCRELAEDIVRNGEGVHHVIHITVKGAPSDDIARKIGKAIVNSALVKCAVCGNDPNVGRAVAAIGKYVGTEVPSLNLRGLRLAIGGHEIFRDGAFRLSTATETALVAHLKAAELYASAAAPPGGVFKPPVDYPAHDRCVEIAVSLDQGAGHASVLGADLTHEYISENADYRS